MIDVICLNEFLDEYVNPYKWINEINIYDKKNDKYYSINDLYLKRDKKSEKMIIEIR